MRRGRPASQGLPTQGIASPRSRPPLCRSQPSEGIIDSQSLRAAQTVPAPLRGYDAGKKINGRKRHIAVDTLGLSRPTRNSGGVGRTPG
jgi:hypothetical protein